MRWELVSTQPVQTCPLCLFRVLEHDSRYKPPTAGGPYHTEHVCTGPTAGYHVQRTKESRDRPETRKLQQSGTAATPDES